MDGLVATEIELLMFLLYEHHWVFLSLFSLSRSRLLACLSEVHCGHPPRGSSPYFYF